MREALFGSFSRNWLSVRKENDFVSLTQLVCNVAEAFTTTLFLPDRSGKNLYLKSYYSLGNSVIEDVIIPLGQGLVGWVAENNLPVNIAPFKQDAKTLQFYSISEDIQSFLAVPFDAEEGRGVLCIDSKKHYSFTSHHQKIITGFAEQFSRLIIKEKYLEAILSKQGETEIGSIHQICQKIYTEKRKINVLDALSRLPLDLLPYDGCAVSILSDDNMKFFVLRSTGYENYDFNFSKVDKNASLVGLALRKGQILNYPEIKKGARKTFIFQPNEPDFQVKSFLGVPVKSGDQLIGVWSFTSREPFMFDSKHVKIVSIIALFVASALALPKMSALTQSAAWPQPK